MITPRSLPVKTVSQLGQMLRAARKAQKMTQAKLASHIGLSQNRVSHLELHPEELSLPQVLAWGSTLGLELSLSERGPATEAHDAQEW